MYRVLENQNPRDPEFTRYVLGEMPESERDAYLEGLIRLGISAAEVQSEAQAIQNAAAKIRIELQRGDVEHSLRPQQRSQLLNIGVKRSTLIRDSALAATFFVFFVVFFGGAIRSQIGGLVNNAFDSSEYRAGELEGGTLPPEPQCENGAKNPPECDKCWEPAKYNPKKKTCRRNSK